MSTGQILLLGAIAGATIFLGLPVARLHGLSADARAGLSALATGILVFLFWDVMSNAVDPIEAALHPVDAAGHALPAQWGHFAELAVLGCVGVIVGLMSLVYYDAWMRNRGARRAARVVRARAAAPGRVA